MKNKLLIQHLKNCKEQLKLVAKHANALKHTGNLGTAREGFINNFLESNLPESIRYHSGEIFDSEDNRSGQLDIVLHPITSPKLYIHKTINIFPVETVLAVIEVKSNLNASEMKKSMEACLKVKSLKNVNYLELSDDFYNIPYIVFGYHGNDKKNILNTMQKCCNDNTVNCGQLPNVIIVLDKKYCLIKKQRTWHQAGQTVADIYSEYSGDEQDLLSFFKYILGLIEKWDEEPEKHRMPIEKYITKNEIDTFEEWY